MKHAGSIVVISTCLAITIAGLGSAEASPLIGSEIGSSAAVQYQRIDNGNLPRSGPVAINCSDGKATGGSLQTPHASLHGFGTHTAPYTTMAAQGTERCTAPMSAIHVTVTMYYSATAPGEGTVPVSYPRGAPGRCDSYGASSCTATAEWADCVNGYWFSYLVVSATPPPGYEKVPGGSDSDRSATVHVTNCR